MKKQGSKYIDLTECNLYDLCLHMQLTGPPQMRPSEPPKRKKKSQTNEGVFFFL